LEYVKINSLWKRQDYVKGLPKGQHGPLIQGEYSDTTFGAIKWWRVEEKIDGTNIRVFYKDGRVSFGGRTSAAQLPCHLLEYLQATFTDALMQSRFQGENGILPNVILFGEGYGQKIQACGGNYRKDVGFILYDVYIGGWWLRRDDVGKIAEELGIPAAPDLGIMTEEEVIDFVKSNPLSRCSDVPQVMEGVVCRSEPLLLFRDGKPVMWKLKCKEFR
jgi:ATP-dependent RNA circularization protein (DNA/RNA ligase family)